MDYEIDEGEARPITHMSAVPQPSPASPQIELAASPPARSSEQALHNARLAALAQIETAAFARHLIDIEGTFLIALGGQGLYALFRIDIWNTGIAISLLMALGATALAVWEWRRTRLPTETIRWLPIPSDLAAIKRTAPENEAQRVANRWRCESDIAAIEFASNDLIRRRHHLRSGLLGALCGAISGWLAGAFGPAGAAALAASAASAAGLLIGGRLADGVEWSSQRIMQLVVGVLPGVALAIAVLSGTSILYATGGSLVAVILGWFSRQRLVSVLK